MPTARKYARMSFSRYFVISFLDYLVVLIFSMLIYALIDLCLPSIPSYSSLNESAVSYKNSLTSLVIESGISEKGIDGNLLDKDELTIAFLKKNIVASYEENGRSDELSLIYSGVAPITEDKDDNVYYYFVVYKQNNLDIYEDDSNYGQDYFESLLGENFYFDEGFSRISYENCQKLNEHLVNGEGNEDALYDEIYGSYYGALRTAEEDIKNSNKDYVSLNTVFEKSIDDLFKIKIASILSSYIFVSLIHFLLVPLLLKDGKTLVSNVMKGMLVKDDEGNLKFHDILFNVLSSLVINLSCVLLMVFFLFGSSSYEVISSIYFGFFNVIYAALVSFLYIILDLFFRLIFKYKVGIAEFLTKTQRLDLRKEIAEKSDGRE
jgi:hypothetical protein